MERFSGTIEPICDLGIHNLIGWAQGVPWHDRVEADNSGWRDKFDPLAKELTDTFYSGCTFSTGMFVLEPGKLHPAHTDNQPENWIVRVHVPIITNPHAVITMPDGPHAMITGKAYRFNTLQMHSVSNGGITHRVHFIFDVWGTP